MKISEQMSITTIESNPQNKTIIPPIVAQRNVTPSYTASAIIDEAVIPQDDSATRRNHQEPTRNQESGSPPETASAVIEETHVSPNTGATRRSSRATKKPEPYAPAENPVRNNQVKWNETRWRRSHRKKRERVYKGPKVVDGFTPKRKTAKVKKATKIKKASRPNAQVTNFGTCYVFASSSSRSSDATRSDESSVNTADVNRQFEKARKLQEQHILSKQRRRRAF